MQQPSFLVKTIAGSECQHATMQSTRTSGITDWTMCAWHADNAIAAFAQNKLIDINTISVQGTASKVVELVKLHIS